MRGLQQDSSVVSVGDFVYDLQSEKSFKITEVIAFTFTVDSSESHANRNSFAMFHLNCYTLELKFIASHSIFHLKHIL